MEIGKELAKALLGFQSESLDINGRRNAVLEGPRCLKKIADAMYPLRRANGLTASPMPMRFFEKIVYGWEDCWVWRGAVDNAGYGLFARPNQDRNFKCLKAHRMSYELFVGTIPDGKKVLHKCDNRQCVNPDHLFLGTQADNVRDMVLKGRQVTIPRFGEKNPMAKTSVVEVEKIRTMVGSGSTQRAAARRFNLSPMTISRIVRGLSWN